MPLVGPPMANRFQVKDQTKRGSKTTMVPSCPCKPGPGLKGERLVAGPFPVGPGRAQPEEKMWDPFPVGSPSAGEVTGVGCSVRRAVAEGGGLGGQIPGCRS